MVETVRRSIIDPDNADNLVNIVESSSQPGVFGLVALNPDGTPIAGGGGISGPITSTDNAIPRRDGTSGDTLQDSGITIDDNDFMDGVDAIGFNTTPTTSLGEGQLGWNADDGTLQVGMPGGNVAAQLAQEMLFRVTNTEGSQINNGIAVLVNGASGNTLTVRVPDITSENDTYATIALATEDIADTQKGYVTTEGFVRDFDTSAFAEGSQVFLSSSGGLSNTPPAKPNRTVFMGNVKKSHATEGEVWVKIVHLPMLHELSNVSMGTLADDDILQYDLATKLWENKTLYDAGISPLEAYYPASGSSIEQQTLNITTSGANIYMETEAVGTGDITYIFDEKEHVLDCTTGAGAGGKAQVALTAGTATAEQINYIYVVPDGAGVATLTASTSIPTGTFAWHSLAVVQDATTVASTGPLNLQRMTEALKHNGRGQLSYDGEKLRWLGAKYLTGCAQTLNDGATLDLTVASGTVFQKHRQTFPGLQVSVDGIYAANASGAGTLTKNQKLTDLDDIGETADGTTISNNRYFSVSVYATMASSDQNGNQSKLFFLLPTDVYLSSNAAIADSSNFDVRAVDDEYNNTAFLVCRVVCQKTAGGNVPIGDGVYSLLGSALGTTGGGAGSVALTEFSDAQFKIYDNVDPTKIVDFQASGITTGTTRTLTVPDASGTIALTSDITLQTAFDGGQTITIADTDNQTLTITNNDSTNNPNAVYIDNNTAGIALSMRQDGNARGLQLYSNTALTSASLVEFKSDNASSTKNVLDVINDGTGNSIFLDPNASTGVGNLQGAMAIDNTDNSGNAIAIYSNRSTSSAHLLRINQDNAGASYDVSKIINDGTGAALLIDQNGNGIGLNIDNTGTEDSIQVNTDEFRVKDGGDVVIKKSMYLTEQAAAGADTAGDGQFRVKNDTPNTPYFTDDAGTDFQLATTTDVTNKTESFVIACSDESTALTTGTAKATFRMPYGFTLTGVRASVTTAPTGSVLTVDINESGTSVLSTKLTIDATEKTSTTAATAAVISDSALADDAEITIDVDTIGSSVAGAGLKVYLIGHQ